MFLSPGRASIYMAESSKGKDKSLSRIRCDFEIRFGYAGVMFNGSMRLCHSLRRSPILLTRSNLGRKHFK